MSKHDTTRKARSAEEIDFREIDSLISSAESGDEIATQEISNVVDSFKQSGFANALAETVAENINVTSLANKIIQNYIIFFNEAHETDFETLDQIKEHIKENNLEVDDKIDFNNIIEQIDDSFSARPKNYVRALGKLTDKVFENALTLKKGQKGKKQVFLDRKKTISVFASINYEKVFENLGEGANVPELTEDDRQVLDGVNSNLYSGNNLMTYNMIYRGFSGKIDNEEIYIPDEIYQMIDVALDHFRGILKIKNSNDEAVQGTRVENFSFEEPILNFAKITKKVKINGKEIDGEKIGIIYVYDYPTLYKFAQMNGNEIDTRDIKLLNVPKINNTPENLKLKRYLYHRVISMRSNYERKVLKDHKPMTLPRKILFSKVFDYIGAKDLDRKKKYKIVQRIESILKYWVDFGLISGYTKTKKTGSNEVDGVEISFSKKIEEK